MQHKVVTVSSGQQGALYVTWFISICKWLVFYPAMFHKKRNYILIISPFRMLVSFSYGTYLGTYIKAIEYLLVARGLPLV